MTHLLKLHDKIYKYEMDPTKTVGDTEWTQDVLRTDGWTDGVKPVYPSTTLLCGGYNYHWYIEHMFSYLCDDFHLILSVSELTNIHPTAKVIKTIYMWVLQGKTLISSVYQQWRYQVFTQSLIRKYTKNNFTFQSTANSKTEKTCQSVIGKWLKCKLDSQKKKQC